MAEDAKRKWTPGPWEFKRQAVYKENAKLLNKSLADHVGFCRDNDGSWAIIGPDEHRVAVATFRGSAKRGDKWNAPDPEGQANARLMAKAPEMFDLLREFVNWGNFGSRSRVAIAEDAERLVAGIEAQEPVKS